MDHRKNINKLGVIIGRFQVDELHEGHRAFIREVTTRHARILILVGDRNSPATDTNPLPFYVREQMLRDELENVTIIPLNDCPTDEEWSQNVDNIVRMVAGPHGAILYSGRKGFIPHYKGKYETKELALGLDELNATEIRQQIAYDGGETADFRRGIIYAMQHLQPRTYESVDVAMLRRWSDGVTENVNLLLARKPHATQWRLPGGFVDMGETFKQAARRELYEETGLVFESDPDYIGDFLIEDWRLRDTKRVQQRTMLFAGWYSWGEPKANDDIEEVCWLPVQTVLSTLMHQIVPEHRGLILDGLVPYITSKGISL